jgi:hypothetical protein
MSGNQDQSERRKPTGTRERLRKAERGDLETADEVSEMDVADDSPFELTDGVRRDRGT